MGPPSFMTTGGATSAVCIPMRPLCSRVCKAAGIYCQCWPDLGVSNHLRSTVPGLHAVTVHAISLARCCCCPLLTPVLRSILDGSAVGVQRRAHDLAAALDAADGVMDGKYVAYPYCILDPCPAFPPDGRV